MNLLSFELKALSVMRDHGLPVTGPGKWTFKWDNAKSRAGQCDHRMRVISMSRVLAGLWPASEVMDTLLHEIAHAVAGHAAGHGPEWKRVARSVGAKPERCAAVTDETPQPPGTWTGTCPDGHTWQRYAAAPPKRRVSCSKCSPGVFDASSLITWTRNAPAAAVTSPRYVKR